MFQSIFGITIWSVCLLAATTISGQQHTVSTFGQSGSSSNVAAGLGARAGKNLLAVDAKIASTADDSESIIENVRSSSSSSVSLGARSLADASKLNGVGSSDQKQVAKVTPPESPVQFIKRFNPNDGSTTTINPKLVTLPGGAVQTTEEPEDLDPAHHFTTTPLPITTRAITTTSTTHRPITTTYRPNAITRAPLPISRGSFVNHSGAQSAFSGPNKPFNVFDFYRTLYNPTTPRPASLRPFHFNRPVFDPPASSQIFRQSPAIFNAQPAAAAQKEILRSHPQQPEQQQPVLRHLPKPVAPIPSFVAQSNLITSPIIDSPPNLLSRISPQVVEDPKPVAQSIVSAPAAAIPSNLAVAVPHSLVQTLEKSVAPPPSANHVKPTLSPRINVDLGESGHKFINRFVVDEDSIRDDAGLFSAKVKLDNNVIAPPVTNVRPILSPKISVHVGETAHSFINRFVLTEEEKSGKSSIPGKVAVKQQPAQNSFQSVARPQINAAGQTDFTRRFEVDDVNKRLFQTAEVVVVPTESAPIRAPQSHIFFNNRINEGVNNFHYRPQQQQQQLQESHNRFTYSRSLDKEDQQPQVPLFNRVNLRLPSFDQFKTQQH